MNAFWKFLLAPTGWLVDKLIPWSKKSDLPPIPETVNDMRKLIQAQYEKECKVVPPSEALTQKYEHLRFLVDLAEKSEDIEKREEYMGEAYGILILSAKGKTSTF